uniref:Uncharacterized protein n=1 Tax=Latimeria chalumnae TaxID=7897 RepID=H3AQF7_LATCH
MASGEDKVVVGQPSGDGGGRGAGPLPLNPGIPIRGIRMKFAVLTGLVEVGEVNNRDIVETIFNLIAIKSDGGGTGIEGDSLYAKSLCV